MKKKKVQHYNPTPNSLVIYEDSIQSNYIGNHEMNMDMNKTSSDEEAHDNCIGQPSGSQSNYNFNNETNFYIDQIFDNQ